VSREVRAVEHLNCLLVVDDDHDILFSIQDALELEC
jgi:hypothetical protein